MSLAVVAAGCGLYRTLLAERISQIQFAIDDVGAALMRRPVFASTFRGICEGLLDGNDFEEMQLELAIRFWLQSDQLRHGVEWIEDEGDLVDGLVEGNFPGCVPGPVITLRDLARRGQAHGYPQHLVFEKLASLTLRGDLLCHRSKKGLCCNVIGVLRLAGGYPDYPSFRVPWNDVFEAIELVNGRNGMAPGDEQKANASYAPLRSVRTALLSVFGSPRDLSVKERLMRLGQRIGVVDLTKLVIGKGLENRLLSDHESLDRYGELMSTYGFAIDEVKTEDDI